MPQRSRLQKKNCPRRIAIQFLRWNSKSMSPNEVKPTQYLVPGMKTYFFRKNRWRSSIGNQRDKALLGNLIRRKFGHNPLIVLGDGSPSSAKFHAPTKGVGLRMDLHRLGFRVVLIDEFKTSTSCLDCFSRTETFQKRPSPRPWRKHLQQTVHGLLECNSEDCKEYCNGNSRKWNRDLLAVLNFQRIWWAHNHGHQRPADLSRQPAH